VLQGFGKDAAREADPGLWSLQLFSPTEGENPGSITKKRKKRITDGAFVKKNI